MWPRDLKTKHTHRRCSSCIFQSGQENGRNVVVLTSAAMRKSQILQTSSNFSRESNCAKKKWFDISQINRHQKHHRTLRGALPHLLLFRIKLPPSQNRDGHSLVSAVFDSPGLTIPYPCPKKSASNLGSLTF